MLLKTVLVCDDKSSIEKIQELIGEEGSLSLLDTVSGMDAIDKIKSLIPEVVWIDLQPAPVRGLTLLAKLRESYPEVSFLVSYGNLDVELMRTAYRLGASDFLEVSSSKSDLASSVRRVETQRTLKAASLTDPTESAALSHKDQPLDTLLVCDAGKEKRQAIEALIKGRKQIHLTATVSIANAVEKARLRSPQLIWIELSPDPVRALALLGDLREKFPLTNIFVSYDVPDAKLIRASYRLGASDFLDAQRWRTDLGAALQSIQPGQKQASFTVFLVLWVSVLLTLAWWLLHR
jgi:two-component system alkaline phosphatase synthesis response regulator PhoP